MVEVRLTSVFAAVEDMLLAGELERADVAHDEGVAAASAERIIILRQDAYLVRLGVARRDLDVDSFVNSVVPERDGEGMWEEKAVCVRGEDVQGRGVRSVGEFVVLIEAERIGSLAVEEDFAAFAEFSACRAG